ncbi:MAG: GyrI-like domain-containing protein [Myxococcaceae bacterium]|nr:GyrI-like domain-containing protein [Myxococcaceae bacterium]
MSFEVHDVESLRVAAVAHRGPVEKIRTAFEKLDVLVRKTKLRAKGLVGIYPERGPAWAGVIVDEADAIPKGLTPQRIEAGRYATRRHDGDSAGLPEAWKTLRWDVHWYYPFTHQPGFERYDAKLRPTLHVPIGRLAAVRPQPLLVVKDVQAASRWYQALLNTESAHGGTEYDRLMVDGALVLQLHAHDEAHHHGFIADPAAPFGNGVAVWFEVTDLKAARARAKKLKAEVVTDVHVNPNANQRELWLKDPEGYLVVLAESLSGR